MKKRILYLIVLMLFVVGCEAVYTIEIMGDNFTENLVVNNRDQNTWETQLNYAYYIRFYNEIDIPTNIFHTEGDLRDEEMEFYQTQLIEEEDNLGIKANHNFNSLEEYQNSTIVSNHFPSLQIREESDRLIVRSFQNNSFNMYPYLTNLTIRLVTDLYIISHNADQEDNGVLYWTFTRENYENKEINFQLDSAEPPVLEEAPDNDEELGLWEVEEDGFLVQNTLIIIYLIIGGFIIIGLIIFFVKFKLSNR